MIDLDLAPDQSPHTPGNLTSVRNFVATVTGAYATSGPPTLEGYAATSATDVVGSALVKNASGSSILYAGTQTKLWQANGTTGWTDRSAKAYSTAATGTWEFQQFGNTTYAANGADTIQKATGAAFADTATAPIARSIISHENALIALNLSTDGAGWARSDTGSDTFTITASNDADSGTFLSGSGPITAGTTFGNLAIAFKDDWMYGGRFVGDIDQKVRWDTLAKGIGCVGQHAHISTELGIIFVSKRDILLFDGSAPRSIADKVRKAFFGSIDASYRANIWISHDEIDRNIYIWVPHGSASGYPTWAWTYNYHSGKWGRVEFISSTATTVDYIRCPVRNVNYTDYLAVGGTGISAGLNTCVVWGSLSGTGRLLNYARTLPSVSRNVSPVMVTGYMGQADRDSRLTSVYVVPDTTNSTFRPLALTSGSVESFNPSLSTSTTVTGALDANGNLDVNAENRFHQATLTWTSGTTDQAEVRSIIPRFYGMAGSK